MIREEFLLAGMTGLFLARGATKYPLASPQYRVIPRISIGIFGLTLIVVLAAAIDAYFIISIAH